MAPAIETRDLCKRFGAVQANDCISLVVEQGTVHGIVGENGAGQINSVEDAVWFLSAQQW